jgi:hypothetical protein
MRSNKIFPLMINLRIFLYYYERHCYLRTTAPLSTNQSEFALFSNFPVWTEKKKARMAFMRARIELGVKRER